MPYPGQPLRTARATSCYYSSWRGLHRRTSPGSFGFQHPETTPPSIPTTLRTAPEFESPLLQRRVGANRAPRPCRNDSDPYSLCSRELLPAEVESFVTATQSTSTSKGPVHSGTQKKMRAGGLSGSSACRLVKIRHLNPTCLSRRSTRPRRGRWCAEAASRCSFSEICLPPRDDDQLLAICGRRTVEIAVFRFDHEAAQFEQMA